MGWIIGLIAVVGFAYLMYSNQSFRRFGFGLLLLIAAGAAVLWFFGEKQNRDFRAKIVRERSAISASELVLSDMQLGERSYGWSVDGVVLNRSQYPLRALTITVFLRSCPPNGNSEACVTTGQEDARFYIEVPPGQARAIGTSVQFDGAPDLQPGWAWDYEIKEIEANLDTP